MKEVADEERLLRDSFPAADRQQSICDIRESFRPPAPRETFIKNQEIKTKKEAKEDEERRSEVIGSLDQKLLSKH